MIYGGKYWNDISRYHVQTNNAIERLCQDKYQQGYLETCGSTSAINCLKALGYNIEIKINNVEFQPEDLLTLFFNDPNNKNELNKIRQIDGIPKNRIPQYYPYAVKKLFNAEAKFEWVSSLHIIIAIMQLNNTIQLQLKNPGHYIAVVAYDDETNELIYNDSWPERFPDKVGFNKRLTIKEFDENVEPFCIIYRR